MIDSLHAFLCTVSEEVHGVLFQVFLVCLFGHYVGTNLAYGFQCSVVYSGIHLHASGVQHRTQQGVLFWYLSQQHGHAEQLQCWYGYQLQVSSVADTFGHRYADAQSGIRTRTATYCYRIKRDGVIICKRESLVNHRAQTLGVVRSAVIFLLEYYVRIFRDGYRTYICTCFNM